MPLTKLDTRTALIVVDLQKGIAIPPTVHPVETVVGNARDLAAAFREYGLPVVLVNVAGAAPGRSDQPAVAKRPDGWTELVPELNQQPSDHLITKFSWGAFTGTGLNEFLVDRGVTHVVLSGIATSMGVETTARQAYELGFNVTVAVDAVTDRNPESHRNSVERLFPKLAETGTTAQVIDLLRTGRTN
jgi:nicotinamidase-related amidase